jgi:hypothetical protein
VALAYAAWLSLRVRSWRPLLVMVAALLALNGVVGTLKLTFGRLSPNQGCPWMFAGGTEYPSGHASNSLVTWGTVLWLLQRYDRQRLSSKAGRITLLAVAGRANRRPAARAALDRPHRHPQRGTTEAPGTPGFRPIAARRCDARLHARSVYLGAPSMCQRRRAPLTGRPIPGERMARVKKVLGHEQRACPTCQASTTFEVYESWDGVTPLKRTRLQLARRAECLRCHYRVTLPGPDA